MYSLTILQLNYKLIIKRWKENPKQLETKKHTSKYFKSWKGSFNGSFTNAMNWINMKMQSFDNLDEMD